MTGRDRTLIGGVDVTYWRAARRIRALRLLAGVLFLGYLGFVAIALFLLFGGAQ